MADETGAKWWIRYVAVPLLGGGAILSLLQVIKTGNDSPPGRDAPSGDVVTSHARGPGEEFDLRKPVPAPAPSGQSIVDLFETYEAASDPDTKDLAATLIREQLEASARASGYPSERIRRIHAASVDELRQIAAELGHL